MRPTSRNCPLAAPPTPAVPYGLLSFALCSLALCAPAVAQSSEGVEVIARINAGGPAVFEDGHSWSADAFFEGGRLSANPGVTEIAGTDADSLYLSGRTSTGRRERFSYRITVPEAGLYTVRLHFVEIYWGVTGGEPGGVGSRVFDVDAEGQTILDDYDITADVGPATAAVKGFAVLVADDDILDLSFFASVDQPHVSAIEVTRASPTPTASAPLSLALAPPTPNPSSARATIRMDLPEPATVHVGLYDALGRRVWSSTEAYGAGAGQSLPIRVHGLAPGVYVYRVRAEMGGRVVASSGTLAVAR